MRSACDNLLRRPGLQLHSHSVSVSVQVCRCQMARYCSRDCQLRHWGVHKPVCKAACQPGGITQKQALRFTLDEAADTWPQSVV